MNQKGFINILLIVIIVILVAVAGYFVLVRKPETPPITTPPPGGTAAKEVVIGFLKAKQSRNFENAKPFLNSEFAKTFDPIGFAGTSNPHTGRFEIKDIKSLPDEKTYEVSARVYQEYTGEGDIGYNDNQYYVRLLGSHYLIDDIKYGEYVELPTLTNPQAVIITDVNPVSVNVGNSITIKGSKFSDNRNVVILAPKNLSLLPSYDINAYKIVSSNNGTEITITITPENFEYGDCRLSGGMCQGELGKIPDGVYYLRVLNNICTGYDCESNRFPLTITNQ